MLKSFEPRENVRLYLCQYNLWSSWALLWGWGYSGAAWRVPLGVRHLEPLGPCQQLPVAMVIGECSHWGLAGSARRFRGQICGVPRASSSPELMGGRSMGCVISFPTDPTDTFLDSFIHSVHSIQYSRLVVVTTIGEIVHVILWEGLMHWVYLRFCALKK